MKKTYVLDTNILLSSPNAIYGFADNHVVVTGTTLQELDSKKTMPGEIGYNARETCRIIESLRIAGDIVGGVILPAGGVFRVTPDITTKLPTGYSLEKPDNRIIGTVRALAEQHKDRKVTLVTNDISMRINAVVCGVENVEFYRNDHISTKEEYMGRAKINVSPETIDAIYAGEHVTLSESIDETLIENEYLTLSDGERTALGIFQKGQVNLLKLKDVHPFGITPKNTAQQFALHALLAPVDEIPFVILKGPAGCAKTFLSLAAGLAQTYTQRKGNDTAYDRILISRNNVMSDADFGYLPGDLEEKMNPLLAPFLDNLESLLRGKSKEDSRQIQIQIEDMFESGIIDICPMAYIRGRSITNSYLILDEAQNASRKQIKDLITRAGIGTKIVIAEDFFYCFFTHNKFFLSYIKNGFKNFYAMEIA